VPAVGLNLVRAYDQYEQGRSDGGYIGIYTPKIKRDGLTDRRTKRQTPHNGIGRTCVASRGKIEAREIDHVGRAVNG